MSQRYPGGVITKSPTAPTQTAATGVWTLEQVAENVKNSTWPPNGPYTYVENLFSTHIYNGTGATQTITNNINLSESGGMVWIKCRSNVNSHELWDTSRGVGYSLRTDTNLSNRTDSPSGNSFSSFNTNGFTLGADTFFTTTNQSGRLYNSWSFRKAAKFFDIVTYTGTGSAQAINHNLGSVPGVIIVKRTDSADDWCVYHRSRGASKFSFLNSTNTENTGSAPWNDTLPTSTQFTVGTATYTNASGGSYIAYLFAHDQAAFGKNRDQDIIQCGSYSGNGTTQFVDLGWEPQWLLVKNVTTAFADQRDNWTIVDNIRGLPARYDADSSHLFPNLSDAENRSNYSKVAGITPTGFDVGAQWNESGTVYIYIAIRRGPMEIPTDSTKVFMPTVYTGNNVDNRLISTTIAPDFVLLRQRNDSVVTGMYTGARLTNQEFLITGSANAGTTDTDSFMTVTGGYGYAMSSMSGVWVGNDITRKFNANTTTDNHVIESFKRAPGFMDIVCYTGTGANATINHNLGVAPEMIIVKCRSAATGWRVYHSGLGNTDIMILNSDVGTQADSTVWNNTTPTSSVFSLGTSTAVNGNGATHIAILFASLPGISKVGSYTGTDATQQINCGFTSGARFLLIKRTDASGNWFVYDSARGMASGNDPYLFTNLTTAEVTTTDRIASYSSGFEITNEASSAINISGASYLYLAIA